MKVSVKVKAGSKRRKRMLLTPKDIQEAVCDGILQANAKINPPVAEGKRVGFWKKIWWIIKGEGSKDGRYSSGIFASLLGLAFNFLAVVGVVLCIVMIATAIYTGINLNDAKEKLTANLISIVVEVVYGLTFAVFALMFRGAANDMKLEKDRNYIIALFSGVVSLVALIVSFVALAKG